MGAAQGMCCSDTCCGKDGDAKNCGDIVRARPMHYPGLESLEDPKAKAKHAASQYGRGSPSGSRPASPERGKEAGGGGGGSGPETQEVYDDGSSYVGQLSEGLRHGAGVWSSSSEQYSGQWKCDQRDGQGRQTWQDGRVYEGQFRNGKFHGYGHMEWHMPDGLMVYEGQYVDDLKDGEGRYIWPDGRMYEGQWKQGHRSGRATYTNSLGQKREGIWKDDKVERWLDQAEGASPAP
mmetsp:Transcript_106353/g.317866  ORF Transcript_106353/g.317866 Transcript_106353/m.317866 type:complete len:235 (-) Transcript_106353:97-801(-)